MTARLFQILVLGVAMLPFEAVVAYADDGPPQTLLSAAGRLRPSETIERVAASGLNQVLVTLAGYGADPTDDRYWAPVYAATPELRPIVFGRDIGTYDTRGSLADSGNELRRSVQRLVTDEDVDSVAIAGVSQGGVVASEACRLGLSTQDNVRTITMLGSPVNGSTTARIIRSADRVATALGAHETLRALAAPTGVGLDDQALSDLAQARSFDPTCGGVAVTQLHNVFDEVVFSGDAEVPGATLKTVGPLPPGAHGGQVNDERTLNMVVAAIRGEEVATSIGESVATTILTPITDLLRGVGLVALATVFVLMAVGLSNLKVFLAPFRQWLD